jgi:hypothetical protein
MMGFTPANPGAGSREFRGKKKKRPFDYELLI